MKLVSFAITNYRSITGTSKLRIREGITTLIGPNNEGKSNVLRAMVTALLIASRLNEFTFLRRGRLRSGGFGDRTYEWTRDYPVPLQQSRPNGMSEFEIEFQLTSGEIADFWTEVGSSLNGTLPIRIGVGPEETTFAVRKKGPGGKALSAKAIKIGRFIAKRIDLQHIPAVRPAATAITVVEAIVARELEALTSNEEYQQAVHRIEELQEPVLREISKSVGATLKVFLPNVTAVQVHVPRDARVRALSRSCEVIVDDGIPTELSRKGDGVQSLAALSLMRHASRVGAQGKQVVLAIEEPESHLHPKAIHQLLSVLNDISKQHQVILTTHCPLFVDRYDIKSNILVTGNRAQPASSIREIRDSMGIRVSDNLIAADVLLMVEGEEDRRAMRALLSAHSPKLNSALKSGAFAVDSLVGAGNLGYKLTLAREAMCITHSLIDYDVAGKQGVKRAMTQGVLLVADLTYTTCLGMAEAELEDWYDAALIEPVVASTFGIPAGSRHFTSTKKKWSDRMRELFLASGKTWDDATEMQVKWKVADVVSGNPAMALLPARKSAFDALVASLEAKMTRPTSSKAI